MREVVPETHWRFGTDLSSGLLSGILLLLFLLVWLRGSYYITYKPERYIPFSYRGGIACSSL